MSFKEILKKLTIILMILYSISNLSITSKIEFNKLEAEQLLRKTYKPLETIATEITPTENNKFFLVPEYIKNKHDFIKLFSGKVDKHILDGFYEDLVIDKNGKLLIDGAVYIPCIYGPEAEVTLAYIKKKRKLISYFLHKSDYESEKLIIRESCIVSGEWTRRTNYFTRNQNGEWILDYFNGISKYSFDVIENNPWSKYRESKY